ncbi:MAG: 4Fe-4S binding protein, partial [Chitinispirillaceae bacterium]|nr:4Fe-4S binding protein [Chitinispirillaceae bacterium]
KTRILSQLFFFLLFCAVFFFINAYPRGYSLPADLFLRLSPLTALLTEIAARAFIPSVLLPGLLVVAGTVVFGRFFCGFVCPLGACIDFSDTFLLKKLRLPGRRPPRSFRRFKYLLLSALAVLALFGVLSPLIMDPVALLTRTMALIINPLIMLLGAIGIENAQTIPFRTPFFYGILPVSILFLAVFAGGLWDRRFWCQYICPSGALFGLLSRSPLFRRVIAKNGCTSCGACVRACPVRAIDPDTPEKTLYSECIVCGQCTSGNKACGGFGFAVPVPAAVTAPDLKKRHFLLGALGGILLVPLFRTEALGKSDGHGRLIRPPGAVPEKEFLALCIACGNCIKACPSNALQPCSLNDGFNRLFTPKVVPRIGACDPRCRLCGSVCPTEAIRLVPRDEKPYVKIGTAVVDTRRCIAWAHNRECLVCGEVCPFNAIESRLVQTAVGPIRVPAVRKEICTGCGLCEKKCPVTGRAAIEVHRFGETRRASGGYAGVHKKRHIGVLRIKPESGAPSDRGGVSRLPGISR